MRAAMMGLVAAVWSLLFAAPAGAAPPPGQGCCFEFNDSPVVLCLAKGACTFTTPPGGK